MLKADTKSGISSTGGMNLTVKRLKNEKMKRLPKSRESFGG